MRCTVSKLFEGGTNNGHYGNWHVIMQNLQQLPVSDNCYLFAVFWLLLPCFTKRLQLERREDRYPLCVWWIHLEEKCSLRKGDAAEQWGKKLAEKWDSTSSTMLKCKTRLFKRVCCWHRVKHPKEAAFLRDSGQKTNETLSDSLASRPNTKA